MDFKIVVGAGDSALVVAGRVGNKFILNGQVTSLIKGAYYSRTDYVGKFDHKFAQYFASVAEGKNESF